jgi:flap endonuclease-1
VITDPEKLQLVWSEPDEEGILQFLVEEKGFNRDLVLNALKRLKGARQKASQQRMDSFFKAVPAAPKEEKKEEKDSKKRKEAPGAKAGGLKKKQAPASASAKKK